jgi:capsular polysaccharide biosynthesis protein
MDRNSNARLSQANLASAQTNTVVRGGGGAPAAAQPQQPQGMPDISAMIRRVLAHWPVIIVAIAIGGLVTAQVVRMRKPLYKSETVIFYREGIGKAITGPTEGNDTVRTLGTKLKETLLAQQTLRKIIDEYKLYPDIVAKSGYADAVDQMRKKTEFKSRSQDTFAISYEGPDRDTAQKVCARMAELLVAENAKRLQEEHRGTTEFLEVEKKRADEELERVEREISEFLQAHPEFATAKEGLGTEVLALQKKAQEAESRKKSKKAGGGGGGKARKSAGAAPAGGGGDDPLPAVDPLLLAAREQARSDLAAAKRDLTDKLSKYTEAHPDVLAAQARVQAAETNLQRAEEAIAAAKPDKPAPKKAVHIDDPYGEATAAPSVAAAPPAEDKDKDEPKPKKPEDTGDKVVSLEMEWSRMTRALGLARSRQADLEQKLYKAEMIAGTAESGYGSTIAVLDPAYKPSGPSNAPNKTVVVIGLAASIAVGLVLSAAWGLFLDDRLFAASEIEGVVMVPVLGVVPKDDKKKKGKDDKKAVRDGAASGPKPRAGNAGANRHVDARAPSDKGPARG